MMATVPHVASGSGLRKFQADGFLSDRVYNYMETVANQPEMNLGENCLTKARENSLNL